MGLILALFLDSYGIPSVIFEMEKTTRWHPKGSTHNARTMEHYRRLGLSQQIRQLGLPCDHPTDVAYFTRYRDWELARIRMPSTEEKLSGVSISAWNDQVPEPIHRANQMYVEKYIHGYAATRKNITLKYGCTVSKLEEVPGKVILQFSSNDGSGLSCVADYVVGCDGGRSFVRKSLGIRYAGASELKQKFLGGRMLSTYIRAPSLYLDYLGSRRAWHYWVLNPDTRSVLTAINGKDEFLMITRVGEDQASSDPSLVVSQLRIAAGDPDLEAEILSQEPWTAGTALVAEKFGRGRILLAGDSVHLFTPTGGFGMNTGIDDAANLSWKLAAVLQGWGGEDLIGSYEAERQPIALRNTQAARDLAKTVGTVEIPISLEEDSERGQTARREVGLTLADFAEEYGSLGVQLGARYDDSPLIIPDGPPPTDTLVSYTPTSIPGGRTPHFWLNDDRAVGASLYDRLGRGFTLLHFGEDARSLDSWRVSANRLGMPLALLEVSDSKARDLYDVGITLIRPDQYVAWRGNKTPDGIDLILSQVSGHRVR